jgi:DNA-binding NarL/FixJ family response regulator
MRILALTSYGEDQAVVAAVAAGVDGFLTKTVDGEALIAAIRSLAEGRAPLRDQVADALVRYVRGDEPHSPGRSQISSLTRREVEVAWAVAEGLSNREIAQRLALSEKTVKNHVSDILDKLRLSRRAQIVALFRSGDRVP